MWLKMAKDRVLTGEEIKNGFGLLADIGKEIFTDWDCIRVLRAMARYPDTYSSVEAIEKSSGVAERLFVVLDKLCDANLIMPRGRMSCRPLFRLNRTTLQLVAMIIALKEPKKESVQIKLNAGE
jgi:hypothetical protein